MDFTDMTLSQLSRFLPNYTTIGHSYLELHCITPMYYGIDTYEHCKICAHMYIDNYSHFSETLTKTLTKFKRL